MLLAVYTYLPAGRAVTKLESQQVIWSEIVADQHTASMTDQTR